MDLSLKTSLSGRLRNTQLPRSHGLLPLFEAVTNSIHSIESLCDVPPDHGEITVEIIREPNSAFLFGECINYDKHDPRPGNIIGFRVTDNGVGFNDDNMRSFETLDSEYKVQQGCRGVGRLLWLKAFKTAEISSSFKDSEGKILQRTFSFTAEHGIASMKLTNPKECKNLKTCICLSGFDSQYREKSPKTAETIANSLFEHCLWYFIREGGVPKIKIIDRLGCDEIKLEDVYNQYMVSSSFLESIKIKGKDFNLIHLKLKTGASKHPFIAWCAANRVVEKYNLAGKIAGLHGEIIGNGNEKFIYACYVTSPALDFHVRPERTGFDFQEMEYGDLFDESDLSFNEIRTGVIESCEKYLSEYLAVNIKRGRERVEEFVSKCAPRYRPILKRIDDFKLDVDPKIADKDLELYLHEQLAELERSLLHEGHNIMNFGKNESPSEYKERLSAYMEKVDDMKKSDLADYVFHRKVILDILRETLNRHADGSYSCEDLIHEIIMPMRKTSNEITSDGCNLWLIDEKLAFHNFLASDMPLMSMPISDSCETKRPDICALKVFDVPLLMAEGKNLPLATLTIIEVKRPMRNDAAQGEDRDPIEQVLGYLKRIRDSKVKTASGRPISGNQNIPGFCYVLCDLTSRMVERCNMHDLMITSDGLSYFGYKKAYNAYIEVISFDGLMKSASERNRAFFDKLGIPAG